MHCVVGQMDCGVVNVFQVDAVLTTGGSNIAFFEVVKVVVLIKENPNADIKLALTDQ